LKYADDIAKLRGKLATAQEANKLVIEFFVASIPEPRDFLKNLLRAHPDILSKYHHGLDERCRALLANGQKIEAIKLWRTETGDNLLNAKNAIEAL
jgi:hypothetical protein